VSGAFIALSLWLPRYLIGVYGMTIGLAQFTLMLYALVMTSQVWMHPSIRHMERGHVVRLLRKRRCRATWLRQTVDQVDRRRFRTSKARPMKASAHAANAIARNSHGRYPRNSSDRASRMCCVQAPYMPRGNTAPQYNGS